MPHIKAVPRVLLALLETISFFSTPTIDVEPQKYARQQKIASGKIFLTQDGLPVSRQYVWTRMKALCEPAGVERTKVFPHNLRSLFARSFYGSCHDVVRLADVLGHSSIETTRIYLMSTGKEYLRQLDKLGLVQ